MISDEFGKLAFFTNGIYAARDKGQFLHNGGNLDEYSVKGNQARQGAFILPLPGSGKDSFIIIHNHFDIPYVNGVPIPAIYNVYSSLVDMKFRDGEGQVFEKKNLVLQDTINWGFTAVQHANGRDWWFPIFLKHGKFGVMSLIDPNGVQIVDTFRFNHKWFDGSPQIHFSPDGEKLVHASINNFNDGFFLDIMDFDRCTGQFSNHQQLHYPDTLYSIGMAISQNSRFAYVGAYDTLFQFDLSAPDLAESRKVVAIEDGFETIPGFNRLWFRAMGLGPNGKIYISGPGTTQHLHTIHAPDSLGDDCRVGLHDIELPAYTFSTMPNIPYHRLGPIDGSECDTLGIDNVPLARFRHTGQDLGKQFLDLSDYQPDQWFWHFGDGNTSMERQPYHIYSKRGIYKVCLTVSNLYGQDSTCRPVWIDTTFTTRLGDDHLEQLVSLFPSPSNGALHLQAPDDFYPCEFIMYDIQGRRAVHIHEIHSNSTDFSFGHLVKGVYTVEIRKEGKILWTDRWIKN